MSEVSTLHEGQQLEKMDKPTSTPPATTESNPISNQNPIQLDQTATMTPSTAPSTADKEAQEAGGDAHGEHVHPLAKLGSVRKHVLLLIFSIASFVDVCNVSGVAIAVAQIATDIQLGVSQIVWIITAYSLTFASVLLFAGRLSDLFPAQLVFEGGFLALGVFSLVTSFVTTSKYGFLILRGLGGISGAMTIPSSYHLLVHMFPNPQEQQKKLALLGLAGALGNILGLVLAGLCMLASYHWFFRLMAIICFVFTGITVLILPYTGSSYASAGDKTPRWKRLDIVGVFIMAGTLICFILGLTQGPIDGWGSASFIAPFIISLVLAPLFFFWESRIPAKSAVLPSTVWKIKNMVIASVMTLMPFSFWATSQLLYATYWQEVMGWAPLHVAAAALPQGIAALIMGGLTQVFPVIIQKPRWSLPFGVAAVAIAEILQYFSNGGNGMDYWRFCFPAFVIGSAGAIVCFMAASINLITYCPPEMGGVAGAWTQVLAQIGGAVFLAVQAGLEGTSLLDWKRNARGYFFELAAFVVAGAAYVIFYKEPQTPEEEHEATRRRIAAEAANGDEGVYPVTD